MKKAPYKIPTKQNLINVALSYLGRYAASEASLRRVLMNRLRRAAQAHPDFADDHERYQILRSDIETIIEAHKKTGVLNDRAFAETKVHSLRRQGRSRRVIQHKLKAKGIEGHLVIEALAQHDEGRDPQESELEAAMALARRRKWGAFRQTIADEDRKRKDFAGLARAGFSSDIVRRVLASQAPEECD